MGTLFLVATPIGNLSDMTFRGLETLKNADAILCEDTRVTKKLLDRYQIDKPLLTYQHHSSERVVDSILERLQRGASLALVTDAGTPGLADPGGKLIEAIRNRLPETKIIPIPGASALSAAASIAGLPTDEFLFLGFLPIKNHRQRVLDEIADSKRTVIFFETPHKIRKTIAELSAKCDPARRVVVGRELTKMFETIHAGTFDRVVKAIELEEPRGEYVIVVAGKT